MDSHHFGKSVPDLHQSEELGPESDPYQSQKQDSLPLPDPHQSQNSGALEAKNEPWGAVDALNRGTGDQNGAVEGLQTLVAGRIHLMRVRIRIHIEGTWITNTCYYKFRRSMMCLSVPLVSLCSTCQREKV
jgi:hypothetical protein